MDRMDSLATWQLLTSRLAYFHLVALFVVVSYLMGREFQTAFPSLNENYGSQYRNTHSPFTTARAHHSKLFPQPATAAPTSLVFLEDYGNVSYSTKKTKRKTGFSYLNQKLWEKIRKKLISWEWRKTTKDTKYHHSFMKQVDVTLPNRVHGGLETTSFKSWPLLSGES